MNEWMHRQGNRVRRWIRPPQPPHPVYAVDEYGDRVRCELQLEPIKGSGWLAVWVAIPERPLSGKFRRLDVVQREACAVRLHPGVR